MSVVEDSIPLEPVYSSRKTGTRSSLTVPEHDDSIVTRRCLRCGEYYKEKENIPSSCRFHAGEYRISYTSSNMAGVTVGHWTCCQLPDKTSPPCVTDCHFEDPKTSAALNEFEVAMAEVKAKSGSKQDIYPIMGAADAVEEDKEESESDEEKTLIHVDYVEYVVNSFDTLPGIALKFNIKASELMRINKLWSASAIHSKRILLIPSSHMPHGWENRAVSMTSEQLEMKEKARKKAIAEAFATQERTSVEEATYYLMEHAWVPAQAKAARDSDLEFERNARK